MCRRYSKDELRKMLLNIREKIPGVTLRTTVLVGFPGETEEDFEDLMELLEEIRFEHLGGFVYSPEEGTVAEKLRLPAVSEETARQRLSLVTELQEEISLEKNEGGVVHVATDHSCSRAEPSSGLVSVASQREHLAVSVPSTSHLASLLET